MTAKLSRREFLATTAAAAAASTVIGVQASQAVSAPIASLFRFAAAYPPQGEHLFPSDRWLQAVADAGYTHCILQVDPFAHPELIRVVDSFPTIFDMTAGPNQTGYLAWLHAVSSASARHGLKLAFQAWEPVLSSDACRSLPAAWKGPVRLEASSRETLCVSQPEARAWFLKGFERVLEAAPEMDTLVLSCEDNDAALCTSDCPRCGSRPVAVRWGELYRDIQITCLRVRPGFQLILFDWFWEDGYFQPIFSRVAKGTPILTMMELGASYTPDPTHPEWSGRVLDSSLGCETPGTHLARARQISDTYGGPVYIMPTLSSMWEGWELPYVPAVGQVAKKFDLMRREKVAGWVDYDDGGIPLGLTLDLVRVVQHNPSASLEEWLQLLAQDRYGSAADIGREAWEAFDRGVRVFPTVLDFKSIDEYAGRFGAAIGLTPLHPFIAERARLGKDSRHTYYWFDPHNFLTPEAVPAVRHCLGKALESARQGKAHFDRLVAAAPPEARAKALFDSQIAELTMLAWQSHLNFYQWAAAVQGDKSISIRVALRDEISVTRRYRELLQSSPELKMGNLVLHWQLEVVQSVPELVPELFDWKVLDVTGDLFELKIKDLEQQLVNWRT
jgi:hypothetical protein